MTSVTPAADPLPLETSLSSLRLGTMFDHFSFEPASRHPSSAGLSRHQHHAAVPPTSTPSSAYPPLPSPPASSIAELIQQFSNHNLHYQPQYTPSQPYFSSLPPTPSSEKPAAAADEENDDDYDSRRSSSALSTCSDYFASLRAQRQHSTRLQCDAQHVRDISALVERMVDSGEQCTICASPARTDDSGVGEDGEEAAAAAERPKGQGPSAVVVEAGRRATLRYRRSGDVLNLQGCVAKSVRVRKQKGGGRRGTK